MQNMSIFQGPVALVGVHRGVRKTVVSKRSVSSPFTQLVVAYTQLMEQLPPIQKLIVKPIGGVNMTLDPVVPHILSMVPKDKQSAVLEAMIKSRHMGSNPGKPCFWRLLQFDPAVCMDADRVSYYMSRLDATDLPGNDRDLVKVPSWRKKIENWGMLSVERDWLRSKGAPMSVVYTLTDMKERVKFDAGVDRFHYHSVYKALIEGNVQSIRDELGLFYHMVKEADMHALVLNDIGLIHFDYDMVEQVLSSGDEEGIKDYLNEMISMLENDALPLLIRDGLLQVLHRDILIELERSASTCDRRVFQALYGAVSHNHALTIPKMQGDRFDVINRDFDQLNLFEAALLSGGSWQDELTLLLGRDKGSFYLLDYLDERLCQGDFDSINQVVGYLSDCLKKGAVLLPYQGAFPVSALRYVFIQKLIAFYRPLNPIMEAHDYRAIFNDLIEALDLSDSSESSNEVLPDLVSGRGCQPSNSSEEAVLSESVLPSRQEAVMSPKQVLGFCDDVSQLRIRSVVLASSHPVNDKDNRLSQAQALSDASPIFPKQKEGSFLGCCFFPSKIRPV